jgi:hypothetical protein
VLHPSAGDAQTTVAFELVVNRTASRMAVADRQCAVPRNRRSPSPEVQRRAPSLSSGSHGLAHIQDARSAAVFAAKQPLVRVHADGEAEDVSARS